MKRNFILILVILAAVSSAGLGLTSIFALKEKEAPPSKSLTVIAGAPEGMTSFPAHDDINRIVMRNKLEDQAWYLVKKEGKYEEAIAKFKEALNPQYINNEAEKSHPLGGIMKVHKMQGKYEEALKDLQWFLKANPKKELYWDWKRELEALIDYQKTGNPEPVRRHIEYLKNKWPELTKTKGEEWRKAMVDGQCGTTIIRLYDTIGDYENGITYLNEFLEALKKEKGNHQKAINEYTAIRQAFEQDRAQGKRGTPTELIIESDNLTF